MKKSFLIYVILSLPYSICIEAQTSNQNTYFNRLYYTCKTWGYIKYFHSEVAKGIYDWDSVLLGKVDDIKNAATNDEFNKVLMDMFAAAGETLAPAQPIVNVPDSLRYNLNLDWFSDSLISSEARFELEQIRYRFRPRNNYYVGQAFTNGNPTFNNDKNFYQYGVDEYPDESTRILALFRYWNIINYFYPYKNIMDQNWDTTLAEFIPKIVDASDAQSFHTAFLELATRLNDSHGFTSSKTIYYDIFGTYYLPLEIKFIENRTVITKILSSNNNIKAGDLIKSINNKSINEIRDSLRGITIGSNEPTIERNINSRILTGPAGTVKMILENDEGQKEITISRNLSGTEYNNMLENDAPIWNIITYNGNRFGYVDMGRLEVTDIDKMFNELWYTDGIIFDIRNYPNGTLWDIVKYLFYAPIEIAKFTSPDITYPGILNWRSTTIGTGNFALTYEKDIYILFDETTQSQAEYTVMGFEQHTKAVKIGSQTAGADGNVSYVYLPGGITTVFTGLGVFYPDGTPTQRIGIVPDIEVHPTILGIREGKDEVLETALNLKEPKPDEESYQLLIQNFPNPFAEETVVEFHIPKKENVSVRIFNALGQCVKNLYNKETEAGIHKLVWRGDNDLNRKVSSGPYFAIIVSGTDKTTRKMMLVK